MDKIWILGIYRCVLILKSYWSPNNHSSLDWTRYGRLRLSWKLAAWAIELLDHHGLKSQVCFVCCGVLGMVRMIHKGSLEWLLPCNRDYQKDSGSKEIARRFGDTGQHKIRGAMSSSSDGLAVRHCQMKGRGMMQGQKGASAWNLTVCL